jgi:hypothetical protein
VRPGAVPAANTRPFGEASTTVDASIVSAHNDGIQVTISAGS